MKELSGTGHTLKLLPILAPTVYNSFKRVICEVIWNNMGNCRADWFPLVDNCMKHGNSLSCFAVKNSPYELGDFCEFRYETVCLTKFDEVAAFSSMYTNEDIFQRLGREMCIVIDIAIAMSGSEAVVESLYSVMGTQTKPGGQDNDTLVARTVVDWCFPNPTQCEETIKEIENLYIKEDKEFALSRHQIPVFVDSRGRAISKYTHGSKVLDRLCRKDSANFILCDKDKF